MKLKYSLFSRRKFLNGLLGGAFLTFLSTLLYPIIKFVFPPSKEVDSVTLGLAGYRDMAPYASRFFAFGNKPAILVRKENSYQAFLAVCTHLDCTVRFLPDKRMFYCPCHEGWYDENGVNVAGPPPRPLARLNVKIEGQNMIIYRPGVNPANRP